MAMRYSELLHPEDIRGRLIAPGLARAVGSLLFARPIHKRADDIGRMAVPQPPMGVIIQARLHPFPESVGRMRAERGMPQVVRQVAGLLDDVRRQEYREGNVQTPIILMDEEPDLTARQKKAIEADARIVKVPRNTSHARALNMGVGSLDEKSELVMVTQTPARYVTNQAFRAMGYWSGEGKIAAYGPRIPDANASLGETVGALVMNRGLTLTKSLRHPDAKPGPGSGFMAADRAGFARWALKDPFGFDEGYERGGGDSEWAIRQLALNREMVLEPAMAVRLTEGLSPGQLQDTWREWQTLSGPTLWYDQGLHLDQPQ